MAKFGQRLVHSWQQRPAAWRFYLLFLFLVLLLFYWQLWQQWWTLSVVAAAYGFGVSLMWADQKFLYTFYEDKDDVELKNSTHNLTEGEGKKRNLDEAQSLGEPVVISRQPLFFLVLMPLSVFVLTSTRSLIGIALILALNLYAIIEIWQSCQRPAVFQAKYLAHSKQPLSAQEIRYGCWAATGYLLLLLLLLWLY